MLIPRLVKVRHMVQQLVWLGGKCLCFLKNVQHHLKVLNPSTLRCSWHTVCTQTHAPEVKCFACVMASLTVQVTALAGWLRLLFFFVERAFPTLCACCHDVMRGTWLGVIITYQGTVSEWPLLWCVCRRHVALEAANWTGIYKLLRRALKLR